MSTLTRYRLLNDPKPHVVGIAWVVECVEQRSRIDEEKYKVDLDGINVAGTNKRRRSMLPKHMSPMEDDFGRAPASSEQDRDDGDQADLSMESTSPSMPLKDNDLAPLEKARRRSMFMGRP
ncbi:hypothetical protein SERLADRAFT_463683 [Serpula lacrymans var. lacrymans S7.9]|nr:uncharacterized protein SERLADRAFT_463683 [Serpula lacrymans var. lacrymans S7.9]EGO26520.1 hypothetical protein SERLADRAFT_463683 [Serpula lacrymans var. lacrymans S7.9]